MMNVNDAGWNQYFNELDELEKLGDCDAEEVLSLEYQAGAMADARSDQGE